jgi:hypothetical protein
MNRRANKILMAIIALSALASILFGLRSYGSYLLLRSAYEVGRPQVSSLRAWMTLDHVAASYRVPLSELLPRLGLPGDTRRDESLKDIAVVLSRTLTSSLSSLVSLLAGVGRYGCARFLSSALTGRCWAPIAPA